MCLTIVDDSEKKNDLMTGFTNRMNNNNRNPIVESDSSDILQNHKV